MIKVSQVRTDLPESFITPLQKMVYECLRDLQIPFQRVECEPAVSMEDCIAINERLDMQTVKTLFLCNRQQTTFYLYVTAGDKAFSTKDFGQALGISRVSFAPAQSLMDRLGTCVGGTSVLSLLTPGSDYIHLIMDSSVRDSKWYGCSDTTTRGYMKLLTKDLISVFLNYINREPIYI